MPTDAELNYIFGLVGYHPTLEQMQIHRSNARVRLVAGGERSGKSYSSEKDLFARHFNGKLFWLVARDYARTKAEYDYLCEDLDKAKINFTATKQVDPGEIVTELGIRFVTKSANDPRTLAMEAPDGVLVCEASQIDYESYLRLTGRVAEKRGWLLLSGCLSGNTLVPTTQGLKYISSLVGTGTHPCSTTINSLVGNANATLAFYNGESPTIRVLLDKGFVLEGTPNHKVIAQLSDGSVSWVELKDLSVKQHVLIRYGTNLYGTKHFDLEETYLAGLYTAEGCWESTKGTRGVGRITFTLNNEDHWNLLAKRGFVKSQNGHWRKADRRLAKFFKFIGIDPTWKAHTKEIPSSILEATKPTQIAFLRGLFDGDGTATDRGASLRTVSLKLAQQVQMMLLNMGVLACLTTGNYRCNYDGQKRFLADVSIYDSQWFAKIVGFSVERKQQKALSKRKPRFVRNQALHGQEFLGYPACWVRVKEKEVGFCETYDLHVPDAHSYCANGLIVHNTFESSLGWYPELFQRGQAPNIEGLVSFSLPTWTNLKIFPGGREDPEIKRLEAQWTPEWFMERFGGVPCPPKGRVMSEFANNIHVGIGGQYEFNPKDEVHMFIDPGFADAYAVEVCQRRGDHLFVVDEIYERGLITSDIIKVAQQRPWWNKRVGGVIDIAGFQHQAMPAPAQIWLSEGGVTLLANKVRIEDGIESLKRFLIVNPVTNSPMLHINAKCTGLISEMGGCPNPITGQTAVYTRNESTGKPVDKHNHAIKAVTYGIVSMFGYTTVSSTKAIVKKF